MSPQVTSGVRVLAQMSASTSELISPRRRILSGGISRPSWNRSVASPLLVPGTLPPRSGLWAMLPMKPNSRSPTNIGEMTVTSVAWFWQAW